MTNKAHIRTFFVNSAIFIIMAACLLISIFPEYKFLPRLAYVIGTILFLATVSRLNYSLYFLPAIILPIIAITIGSFWKSQVGIAHLGISVLFWSALYVVITMGLEKALSKLLAYTSPTSPEARS